MNKKIKLVLITVAIVLAVALIIGGIILFCNNSGDTVISIDDKKISAGDNVDVCLKIKKNCGIWGGQVMLKYDAETLSFVSYDTGDVFDNCDYNADDGTLTLLLNQTELENSKKNGVIVTLKFNVKDDAKSGDYSIKFSEESNFCNVKEELITPVLKDGTVTVK